MTMYVYKVKDGLDVNTWDDAHAHGAALEVVAIVEGADNADCERKANDSGYNVPDVYGWGYSECDALPRAATVDTIR